ncbi:hypothetical protein HS1genome_1450 [Sulfodiicoccus acidiphilus]|uniref:Uncharacterized protein n=1 Tax=Sulfodiicoccus acidiphilus TaxID=1670455 RepID=A0A348B4F9_9CREN|nr:hypothetical protein HS1genome_1450 [Sulfodiicoccus acidiphilus]
MGGMRIPSATRMRDPKRYLGTRVGRYNLSMTTTDRVTIRTVGTIETVV